MKEIQSSVIDLSDLLSLIKVAETYDCYVIKITKPFDELKKSIHDFTLSKKLNIIFELKEKLLNDPYAKDDYWEIYVIEIIDELIQEVKEKDNAKTI